MLIGNISRCGRSFAAIAAITLCCAVGAGTSIRTENLKIGTGSAVGVYDRAGKVICAIVGGATGTTCEAVNSGGSLDNLDKLKFAALDAALVQSDWQFHATRGSAKFAFSGAMTSLRSLFSLHAEPLTLIARDDSGIRTLDDLPGHIVNIGNKGSGHRATMEQLMIAKGWGRRAFTATDLPAEKQAAALCDGKVDAIVFMVGHPNSSVREASLDCPVAFIPVDKLISDNAFYAKAKIAGNIYRGQPEPVSTFGVVATLVTTDRLSEAVAYSLVRGVFTNLTRLKQSDLAFVGLDAKAMVRDGLSAPLHPGAVRYFKEAGLLE